MGHVLGIPQHHLHVIHQRLQGLVLGGGGVFRLGLEIDGGIQGPGIGGKRLVEILGADGRARIEVGMGLEPGHYLMGQGLDLEFGSREIGHGILLMIE